MGLFKTAKKMAKFTEKVANVATVATEMTNKSFDEYYDENFDIFNNDLDYTKADDLYTACLKSGMGSEFNETNAKRRFETLLGMLSSNEKPLLPVLGWFNYVSPTVHDGQCTLLCTNKRLLGYYSTAKNGAVQFTAEWKNITSLVFTNDSLPVVKMGIYLIETYTEKFRIGVNYNRARIIYNNMQKIKDEALTPQPVQIINQINESDVYDQLKKLKELYDLGILTTEEFEEKKKILLAKMK